jgi:hypothetical protein
MNNQEREWLELYKALRTMLIRSGIESPFGEVDFWLVDDNWGGNLQKVCVFNMAYLNQKLAAEVQNILKQSFSDWGVMFELEISQNGKKIPPEGVVIFRDRIVPSWDNEKLKAVFNNDFDW